MTFRPLFAAVCLLFLITGSAFAADKPNFVWIVSEDSSKHFFKLFDETGAATPNIARLADEGVLFRHAFSNAPVCSVARTTLITSVYAPRVGTQFHRRNQSVQLPADWKFFPAYLREAGYYTTNNAKKDYNADETPGTWDESSKDASWRKRPDPTAPFFHMQTFTDSHESSLHFTREQMEQQKTETDPAGVTIPPHHPDTDLFRYTYARYHDRIKVIDGKVGVVVKQLEEDGLLDSTFVFFFGDHGGVLPRSKGYLYETGLHVPLVVRIPEKFRTDVTTKAGSAVDGFVSFVDFGPTLMHLAGIDVPSHMDGRPFLGGEISLDELNSLDETYGYADRFDEKLEMVRSLRKGKWKYHRNFQGYLPDALHNNYRYKMLAYQEWRELFHAGTLNDVQAAFFKSKPPEALYDLEADPYETTNLAADLKYRDELFVMRKRLQEQFDAIPDLSIAPESVLVKEIFSKGPLPLDMIAMIQPKFVEMRQVADLALLPFDKARPQLETALRSSDESRQFWALTACTQFGKEAQPLVAEARKLIDDNDKVVRLQAIVFLAVIGAEDPNPHIQNLLSESTDPVLNTIVLNQMVYLRDTLGLEFDLAADTIPSKNDGVERRLEYLGRGEK